MEELQRQAEERLKEELNNGNAKHSVPDKKWSNGNQETCATDKDHTNPQIPEGEPKSKQIKLDNPSDTSKSSIVPIEDPPGGDVNGLEGIGPEMAIGPEDWRSRWKPKIVVKDGQYCRLDSGYQTIFYGAELDVEEGKLIEHT